MLEINKLLKEVRPLSEETQQCSKSDPLNNLDEDDSRYVLLTIVQSKIYICDKIYHICTFVFLIGDPKYNVKSLLTHVF